MNDRTADLLSSDLDVRQGAMRWALACSDDKDVAGLTALRRALLHRSGCSALTFFVPGLAVRSGEEIAGARERLLAMAARGLLGREAMVAGNLASALSAFDLATAAGVAEFLAEVEQCGGSGAVHDFQLLGTQNQAAARLLGRGVALPPATLRQPPSVGSVAPGLWARLKAAWSVRPAPERLQPRLRERLRQHLGRLAAGAGPAHRQFVCEHLTPAAVEQCAQLGAAALTTALAGPGEHQEAVQRGNVHCVVTAITVGIDEAAAWFQRRHGGYTRLLERLWGSEAYVRADAEVLLHVVFGRAGGRVWTNVTIWPLRHGGRSRFDFVPILAIDLLSQRERAMTGIGG